ncbi:hypothetical protein CHARACLAT_023386 [Characodon lateralis]|uniref:Uncharacterized protein n=1 Tax=Characodon lateralis TaxID=208331 RepID=A0ABU7EE37_9TELE|nr:hypothetical protein [Characodon lateralis]
MPAWQPPGLISGCSPDRCEQTAAAGDRCRGVEAGRIRVGLLQLAPGFIHFSLTSHLWLLLLFLCLGVCLVQEMQKTRQINGCLSGAKDGGGVHRQHACRDGEGAFICRGAGLHSHTYTVQNERKRVEKAITFNTELLT